MKKMEPNSMSVALKGNNDYIYNSIVCAVLMLCIWLCLYMLCKVLLEEFEDTKLVIRISMSKKNRQHSGQAKSTKEQTTIYNTHTSN